MCGELCQALGIYSPTSSFSTFYMWRKTGADLASKLPSAPLQKVEQENAVSVTPRVEGFDHHEWLEGQGALAMLSVHIRVCQGTDSKMDVHTGNLFTG